LAILALGRANRQNGESPDAEESNPAAQTLEMAEAR